MTARLSSLAFLLLLAVGPQIRGAPPSSGQERFYIGTYSGSIYQSTLNLGLSTFGPVTKVGTLSSPSFLAFSPGRKFLYSVNESAASVGAFSVNPTNGVLTLLNQVSSGGNSPAHLAVDATGRNVIVANYDGGSISMYPILTNGKLGTFTARFQHPGTAPHPHCITFDAANHFVFVCDKGLDQIRSYIFDPAAGTLITNTALITSVAAGSGPRHMTFDLSYKRAYVICELSSTIIAFNYDSTNGVLSSFQTVSTLPPPATNRNTTAEIVIHPSGKFLYGSNRGYDSIVVYTINPDDGTLTQIQQQTTGRTPRNFAIDPTGTYCIVAGQDSSDIRLYTINSDTGLLTDTTRKITVASPVCILPFILSPPQPAIAFASTLTNTFELSVANTLNILTYELYQAPTSSDPAAWNLLTTGLPGQTNFTITNSLPQEFFQIRILTNY
jgi:6-phosphogluconolactonase